MALKSFGKLSWPQCAGQAVFMPTLLLFGTHTMNSSACLGKSFRSCVTSFGLPIFHPAAMNSCQSDCQAGDNQDRDEYCLVFFSAVHGGYINYIIYYMSHTCVAHRATNYVYNHFRIINSDDDLTSLPAQHHEVRSTNGHYSSSSYPFAPTQIHNPVFCNVYSMV